MIIDKYWAVMAALYSGLLYFTGFLFLDEYYGFFGISLNEVDFSTTFIVINSFEVLKYFLGDYQYWVIIILVLLIYVFLRPARRPELIDLASLVIIVWLSTAYFVLSNSEAIAFQKAKQSLENLSLVPLRANTIDLSDVLPSDRYDSVRHLMTNDKHHFLVVTYPDAIGIYTIRVSVDKIKVLKAYVDPVK